VVRCLPLLVLIARLASAAAADLSRQLKQITLDPDQREPWPKAYSSGQIRPEEYRYRFSGVIE